MLGSPPCARCGGPSLSRIPPVNKPLYLALSHEPDHLVRRFITSFIPNSWKEAQFIGALDGWLVILVDGRDLFLLNKGFSSIIPLPPPPQDPRYFCRTLELGKAVLSSPPSSSSSSSGECTVVLKGRCLSYCRVGSDNSFTNLLDASYSVWDVQFYKEGLYVLCSSNTIIKFDHLFNKVTQLVAYLGDIWNPDCFLNQLLVSENKLLMIAKWLDPVRVFECEWSESRVVRVNDVNENLLLVINNFCSLSITADKHKEFRRKNYDCFRNKHDTRVLYMGKDPYDAKVGDPWPLFFSMFKQFVIKNEP